MYFWWSIEIEWRRLLILYVIMFYEIGTLSWHSLDLRPRSWWNVSFLPSSYADTQSCESKHTQPTPSLPQAHAHTSHPRPHTRDTHTHARPHTIHKHQVYLVDSVLLSQINGILSYYHCNYFFQISMEIKIGTLLLTSQASYGLSFWVLLSNPFPILVTVRLYTISCYIVQRYIESRV